jgi:4-carboxymuconolactone decarboxylase
VKASAPLGPHFHPGGYSLSEREREIAVTIINSKWHSAYPTNAHERRGKEVGLPAEKVEAMPALAKPASPATWQEAQRLFPSAP